MDIFAMEREAQDRLAKDDAASMDFYIIGALGKVKATWLDPFFGFVRIDGQEGFCRSADIRDFGATVEWIKP